MNKLFFLILLLPGLAFSAETGTALKADSLRAEPYADARTVGSFARNDKVEILTRQGAWLKVKTAKTTGWVRLLSVKRGTTASGNQAAGVLGVASGRAGTGQVVATTGVRGLSEEELKSAKFNEEEIRKLESNTLSASQGQQFASNGGLKAAKFGYLPAATEGAR
ncbi:hypothetical protein MTYP_00815 [Methylophilaceae bacterium]|nr:hypothetical protein MTYP_00815 [Methylophilaceae bacterium]